MEILNKRKQALTLRKNIRNDLKALDDLLDSCADDAQNRDTILTITAEINKRVSLKQSALSEQINDKLFGILQIVEKRLQDPMLETSELKDLMFVLKDCSAIVGLIGKTPLIAQQFNNIQQPQENKKIEAIEVNVIDSKD